MEFKKIKAFVDIYHSLDRMRYPTLYFGISTNGTLLNDEVIDFLSRNRFRVLLSMDGAPEVQAFQRPRIDGGSSYRKDMKELIGSLKGSGIPIRARMTFTPHSLDVTANVKHLLGLGFEEIDIVPDLCQSWESFGGNGDDLVKDLRKGLVELARFFVSEACRGNVLRINLFREYLVLYLTEKYGAARRFNFSDRMGRRSIGISTGGEIYPCSHLINQKSGFNGCKRNGRIVIGSLELGIDSSKQLLYSPQFNLPSFC